MRQLKLYVLRLRRLFTLGFLLKSEIYQKIVEINIKPLL